MGTITKNYIIIILFEIECNVMCRVNDLLNTFLFNDCTIVAAAEFTVKLKNWKEKGRIIGSKEKENFKQAGRKTATG
jgi:hypothetical protein